MTSLVTVIRERQLIPDLALDCGGAKRPGSFVLEDECFHRDPMRILSFRPGIQWRDPERTALDVAQVLSHFEVTSLPIGHGATDHKLTPEAESHISILREMLILTLIS